jgi:hypothetical protein
VRDAVTMVTGRGKGRRGRREALEQKGARGEVNWLESSEEVTTTEQRMNGTTSVERVA